jgi:hypothetical protein
MLAVWRLRCRYRVPAGPPTPTALQARLDRVARDRLPAHCAALLGDVLTSGDEGVVVLRRLDLRLVVGSSPGDDATLALAWSRGITRAVARALAVEPDGELVARFASWAHYLARFVQDVAAGTAWTSWCYAPFASLRPLSASAAIREALCQRPAAIVPALGLLAARDRLGWITQTLTEPDAWTVFDAIEPGDDARTGPAASAPDPVSWPRPLPAGPGTAALQLVGATTASGRAPPRRHLAAIRQVAGLLPHLDLEPGPAASGWTAALLTAAERAGPETLAGLRRLLAEDTHALATLLPQPAPVQRRTRLSSDDAALTGHGGVFLLLPGLAELDPARLLGRAGLDPATLQHVVPLGRWLLLLKCLGPEQRRGARHDPALAAAAGLDAIPTAERLRVLSAAGMPPPSDLAAVVAGWAAGRRLTLGRPPVAEAAELPGVRPGTVLRDPDNGLWLAIDPSPPGPGQPASTPPPAEADLRHLSTLDLVGDPAGDLAWSWLAALTLHLFARRLPGFARSSAAHLTRNFLVGATRFTTGDDALTVTLPQAPLRLVLAMGGWGHHHVPWQPGQTLRIQRRAD